MAVRHAVCPRQQGPREGQGAPGALQVAGARVVLPGARPIGCTAHAPKKGGDGGGARCLRTKPLTGRAASCSLSQDLVLLDRAESSPAQPANAASSRSPSGCERSPESSLENLARKISATLSLDRSASERSEPDEPSQGRAASGADGAAALSGPAPSPFTASSKESPTRAALLSRRTSGPKADSSRPPTSGGAGASERRRLAIIMVGLPARGKTFTAQKLARYLNWLGHDTKHFNVGKYRRDFVGSSCSAEFFAADNAEAVKSRNEVARICLADMLAWMEGGGQVAIFDATNSTVQRRSMVTDTLRGMCKIIFLETICTDREMIERNVAEKIHRSPDYTGTDPQEAKRDFMMRMAEYEKAYEPLGDSELQWASSIHVIDIASGAGTMQVSRIQGCVTTPALTIDWWSLLAAQSRQLDTPHTSR